MQRIKFTFGSMSNQNEPPVTLLEDVPFHLARLGIAFTRLGTQTLREEGLGPQAPGTGSVLHALFEMDDIPAKELVERTHLPKGTLSGILDRLEAADWIVRYPNPNDGRGCCVRLTKKGRALEPRMRRRHARIMLTLQEALGERDYHALTRLLDKATRAMREATDASTRESRKAPVRVTRRTKDSLLHA